MNVQFYLKHFPATGSPLKVGTNKAVHGLAGGLASHGANVTVLCEGEAEGRCDSGGGYEIRCFKNSARYRTFRLAPGLKTYLDASAGVNHLVVLNGIFHPSLYSLSCVLARRGVPYVVAPHGPYHPSLFEKNAYLKWPYWYLIERRLLKNARAIQLLDMRQAIWSERLGIKTPVIEAPNGFSPADVAPEMSLDWRTDGPVRILFWGRLDIHTKGLDILLQAFSRVTAVEDAMLTIQGPDWTGQKENVETLVNHLPQPERVVLLPPEFHRPAPYLIAEHDIVCLPSRFEGFGLSVLEAMLAGRVVLVSEEAGIARHVEASDCGVVVKSDAQAVSQGLLALIRRREEWREMGLRGRRYALQYLNWEAIAGNALKQYRQLVH